MRVQAAQNRTERKMEFYVYEKWISSISTVGSSGTGHKRPQEAFYCFIYEDLSSFSEI